jgi:pimeloyl-ACP methyl ester carboxylesterase
MDIVHSFWTAGTWAWVLVLLLAVWTWGNVPRLRRRGAFGWILLAGLVLFVLGSLIGQNIYPPALALGMAGHLLVFGLKYWDDKPLPARVTILIAATVLFAWGTASPILLMRQGTDAGLFSLALGILLGDGLRRLLKPDKRFGSGQITYALLKGTHRLWQCMFQADVKVQAEPKQGDSGILVFVHGLHDQMDLFRTNGYPRYEELLWFLRDQCLAGNDYFKRDGMPAGWDVGVFRYYGNYFSSADPNELAMALENDLAKLHLRYRRIILVGHSFGALLIRKAMLLDRDGSRWLKRVERVVMLAGTNRGFRVPPRMAVAALEIVGGWLQGLRVLPRWLRGGNVAMSCLRGAPWVTDLRLEWVGKKWSPPLILQIRGTEDALVDPDDSLEIYRFSGVAELEVPGAKHGHFSLMPKPGAAGPALRKTDETLANVRRAIRQSFAGPESIRREHKFAARDEAKAGPKQVVFLVHGIRDFADWHESLGHHIEELSKGTDTTVVSVTYGYFSALQFLFKRARKRCLRALVDRYVQYKVRNPETVFHAIGHSNGTYVIGYALKNYEFVSFDNVFFAGSVLPTRFPWRRLADKVRGKVRNDCANSDYPVGLLCGIFQLFGDLGTAGVDGFALGEYVTDHYYDGTLSPLAIQPKIFNNKWLQGGHSVALEPRYQREIAAFILQGEPVSHQALAGPGRGRSNMFWMLRRVGTCVGLLGAIIPYVMLWAIPPFFGLEMWLSATILGAAAITLIMVAIANLF